MGGTILDGLQNVLGSGRVWWGGYASRALGSHLEARYRPLQQVSYGQNLLQADAPANQQKNALLHDFNLDGKTSAAGPLPSLENAADA